MFSNINKTTFGTSAASTSFGLGASTASAASPWGTTGNTQPFGKPGTTAFGQQPTTFGQPTTSSNTMFPFFPQSNSSGFGSAPSTQSTFGSNVFGQQQTTTSNNLFGSNTFGQQKPNTFGFGSQTQQQPNLFGQPAQQQSSLFQTSGTNSLFNSSGAFGAGNIGTTIKFNPVTGTDTMQKSGVTQSINTKHHCITCMKEYEGKSLEELRFEDYQANRKGVQSQFGSTSFGNTSTMFGENTENKTAFGQATPFGQTGSTTIAQTFGQPGGFGLNTQPSTSNTIFGKPPAFGTTGSTANTFGGFSTASNVTNTFGTTQNKPFGAPAATSLFGTTQPAQQTTPFGSTLFGQNNQNTTGSFFNKPAQTTGFNTGGFGFTQTPSATTPSNLFQQSKPAFGTAAAGAFGQTTPAFGQTAPAFGQTTPAFGQAPAFGQTAQQNTFGASTFGKPLAFGQNLNTFQTTGENSLFSNSQQKTGSLLGTGSVGLFGTNTFGGTNASSGFSLTQNNMQFQGQGFSLEGSQEAKNLPLLASNQFGHSPFLRGLLPLDKPSSPTLYTTNPAEIRKMLETNKKVDEVTNSKLKLKLGPPKSQRDHLFSESADEEVNKLYKTSCKRLFLKKKSEESKQSIFETSSIYNDWIDKNSTVNRGYPLEDVSIGSDMNSSVPSEADIGFPSKRSEKPVDVSFINEHYGLAKQGLEKPISQRSLTRSDKTLSQSTGTGPIVIENTLGRMEILKTLEEPLNKTNSEMSIVMNDSESSVQNPLAIRMTTEVPPSDAIESETKQIGPSGIVLSRTEYYTLPSIENLDQLVNEEGRCMVKGFTVGRRGYGNVYFPDELNVRNLNLDEIVHFRYKEIHMYPDESKKPPVGEGLNRLAQVTLDRVYPRVKETKEIIDDVDKVLAAKFPEQLVEISEKHGLKFVDYRPETGSWVFMVEHFSKYAFTESDEEDCELSISKQNGENGLKIDIPMPKKGFFLGVDENDPLHGSKSDLMADQMNTDLASEFTDDGERQGDILHKSMAIDLEGDDDDFINPIFEPTDHDLYYHNSQIQILKAAFFSDSECASTISSMDYFGNAYKSELFNIKPQIYQRRIPRRPKVYQTYVNIVSRQNDTILLEESRCYSDLGVFKGKIYKVGWASGCKNYGVKFPLYSDVSVPFLSLSLKTVPTIYLNESLQKAILECMNLARENSALTLEGEERIPTYTMRKDRNFLKGCYTVFRKVVERSNGEPEILYDQIWSLCYALWGPGRRTAPFVKKRLSAWLKASVEDKAIRPTENQIRSLTLKENLELIFNHLTCFNVNEAAQLAMQADLPSLSLIISQINLPRKQKSLILHQLEKWYNDSYAEHISLEILKIYFLLSGYAMSGDVNIFENLEWKRIFGLYLWYLTADCSSSELAINAYTNEFSRGSSGAAPTRVEDHGEEPDSHDVLFHILQLYASPIYRLVKALNPETNKDVKTEFQLSWLLLLFFQSIEVGLIEPSEEALVHTSLSAELEENGLWHFAVLPLLYLKDISIKKNLVFGLLNRNLPIDGPEIDDIEAKLIEEFYVPKCWIETVKEEKRNHLNGH